MATGAELIAAERQRQVEKKGYDARHDDDHVNAELVCAAICYADAGSGFDLELRKTENGQQPYLWPFTEPFTPSKDLVKNLVIAGALIAAEIDRLQREGTE
jgi:hypothetical protein